LRGTAPLGRNVSDKPTAPNYAPTEFAEEREAKAAGIKKAALKEAMRQLFATNKIRIVQYGRPSRLASKLEPSG